MDTKASNEQDFQNLILRNAFAHITTSIWNAFAQMYAK